MNKPIRILQIVNKMDRAGMENRLMDIYRNIDRGKVQFDFYTCSLSPGCYDEEIKRLGGQVFYSEPLSIVKMGTIPKRISAFLKKYPEYRIIHCHLNQWCGLILLGAKMAGVPVRIAHSRTALGKRNIKNIVKNIVKLPVNRVATHRLAVSTLAGEWLFGSKMVKKGLVEVWPNAINAEAFKYSDNNRKEKRKQLGLDDKYTIIHVGNFRPEKNHMYLLSVFSEIDKLKEDSVLLLAGEGSYETNIRNKVNELGLMEKVVFLGSRSDIAELLFAADCFIFPSLYEGFPGAVLEAETTGLPCLVSDTVTKEVNLLKTTISLSILEKPKAWADIAVEIKARNRENAYHIIKNSNYDICGLAKKYELFYTDIYF